MTPEHLALRKALWLAKEIGDSGPAFIREIPIRTLSPVANLCVLCERITPIHATIKHEEQCAKYRAQRLVAEIETLLGVKAPGCPEAGMAFVSEHTEAQA